MTKDKQHCKHPKIPDYSVEEQEAVNELMRRIDTGDTDAYAVLTRLAVSVAVDNGRFYKETCEHCHDGISSAKTD